jgi:hypothetical protein
MEKQQQRRRRQKLKEEQATQIFPRKEHKKRGRPRTLSDEERALQSVQKRKRYYEKHKDAILEKQRLYRVKHRHDTRSE